ncbi:unnamed protein product [Vitrella brassicaformis CCMP3155]|uniref:Uncharacterized protein n=1 Tax=Vitrella brassicaformis (strain CCMP3155) TaxID=1169540 RepID=A0A0G4H6U4_VITBC|nr:unnamed protein product [Vitrella brassicaformis CCMP3155]|eukprot:CEM39409.1 unnamed protein product [Vitrella brassicaformis CCMP3155]
MSESASKRQRRSAEREEDDSNDGHQEAVMDTDGQQQQQQQQPAATASHTTHSIDLEAFAQQFSQIPVVVANVFSFVSLHLVAALPQRLWCHVGCQITQLVMDTHDTAERRFWCGLSFADAFEWGRRLTRLRSIVVKYPWTLTLPGRQRHTYEYRNLSPVIEKLVTALVEGHSEGRRGAAATAAGQPAPTTLESIDISEGSIITGDKAEGRDIRAATEPSAALSPPLNPPPTLTSLTSIMIPGYGPSCPGHGRHWQLPSLETVQVVRGTVYPEMLGGLVATSRCLKELHVECSTYAMADSLRRIPTATAGQPGPLSQLEDIGTLRMSSADSLEGLQAVLVDRGCRSIKKLSVKLEGSYITSSIFATLSAIESFARAVCVSPDIVDIKRADDFDLSLLCDVPTRPEPSLFVQKHIQQLAAGAACVAFDVDPQHFATPLDTPSPAAIVLAQCLTFPNVKDVAVVDQDDWEPDDDGELDVYAGDELDDDAGQPDPLVLDSIPDNAFPDASGLRCHSRKGLAIGRRLLTKMPAVKRITLGRSTEEQAVGMLQAVGGERDLECFEATSVTGVGEGGLTWGDMADQLPTIKRLDLRVEVPEDLGDGDAAGEFGIACVKSLLKIRGIEELKFAVRPADTFKRLVEERTNGDTIEGLEGRFDIEWGWTDVHDERSDGDAIEGLEARYGIRWEGDEEDALTLKPLGT